MYLLLRFVLYTYLTGGAHGYPIYIPNVFVTCKHCGLFTLDIYLGVCLGLEGMSSGQALAGCFQYSLLVFASFNDALCHSYILCITPLFCCLTGLLCIHVYTGCRSDFSCTIIFHNIVIFQSYTMLHRVVIYHSDLMNIMILCASEGYYMPY